MTHTSGSKIPFAITPCPNDVFSYCYWMQENDASRGEPSAFEFSFDDIETLNLRAKESFSPITKLSFASYLKNSGNYALLDAGAALGVGTGPVLVGRLAKDEVLSRASDDENFEILVPGLDTTAALLLKFWLGGRKVRLKPMYFRDILPAISAHEADCGVLIHEGRFVFKDSGLNLIEDLGGFWTDKTSLPVPLGCICLRKDLIERKAQIEELIRKGLDYAFSHEPEVLPVVASYAQYLAPDVLKKHIYAFVNKYSFDISDISASLIGNLKRCSDE